MSFRDDEQLARCCRALCARVGLAHLWAAGRGDSGPMLGALDVRDGKSPLSSGEQLIVLAAWSFWSGSGGLLFADLMTVLSHDHLDAIFSLATAVSLGSESVDAWLAQQEVHHAA